MFSTRLRFIHKRMRGDLQWVKIRGAQSYLRERQAVLEDMSPFLLKVIKDQKHRTPQENKLMLVTVRRYVCAET